MLADWELWACAPHYFKRHHENAAVLAAMRADELLAAGELEGTRAFQAIVSRINQLLEGPQGPLQ